MIGVFSESNGWILVKLHPLKIYMGNNGGGERKIIFLSKWVICRFHVNLPGCMIFNQPRFPRNKGAFPCSATFWGEMKKPRCVKCWCLWLCRFEIAYSIQYIKCGFLQLVATLGCNPGSKSSPLYNQLFWSARPQGKTLIWQENQLVRGHLCKNVTHKIHDFWKYSSTAKSFIHIVFMTSQWLFRKLAMPTSRKDSFGCWDCETMRRFQPLEPPHRCWLQPTWPKYVRSSFLHHFSPNFFGGQNNNLPTNIFEIPSPLD